MGLAGFITFGEMYSKLLNYLEQTTTGKNEEILEVLFTQGNNNCNSKMLQHIYTEGNSPLRITTVIKELILSARSSIMVTMYIFTCNTLCNALLEIHKKGVKIFVVVDSSMKNASNSRVLALQSAGIAVKIHSSSTLHHKFCLIDVIHDDDLFNTQVSTSATSGSINIPRNGLVITGSLNWTKEALTTNYESIIISSHAAIVQPYAREFAAIWKQI